MCVGGGDVFIARSVFSNIVRDAYLNELAEADENEIVKQVQVR